jgi:hypothetical protein
MSRELEKIDAALEALRAAGCNRDADTGVWLDKTGAPLSAAGPLEAWRLMRRGILKRTVEAKRSAGECFPR